MYGVDFFGPLTLIAVVGAVLTVAIVGKHRERMAMLEKGLSSDEIKAMYTRDIRRDPLNSMKWGILFVCAGLAVILGYFLVERYQAQPPLIIGLVCLFVGGGLVLFYSFASRKIKQE